MKGCSVTSKLDAAVSTYCEVISWYLPGGAEIKEENLKFLCTGRNSNWTSTEYIPGSYRFSQLAQ
jgi:hypothetical protein